VLANDTDPDFDQLTAALVSGVANGSLTLNSDGSFAYTPSAGFTGNDTFTYYAEDFMFETSNTAMGPAGLGGTGTAVVNGVNVGGNVLGNLADAKDVFVGIANGNPLQAGLGALGFIPGINGLGHHADALPPIGGCFVAGTPVVMAGSDQSLAGLGIGETAGFQIDHHWSSIVLAAAAIPIAIAGHRSLRRKAAPTHRCQRGNQRRVNKTSDDRCRDDVWLPPDDNQVLPETTPIAPIGTRSLDTPHDNPVVDRLSNPIESKAESDTMIPLPEKTAAVKRSGHRNRLAVAWLFAWLTLGAGFLFHGLGGQTSDFEPTAVASATLPTETRLATKPIEQIRVGERVLGENPLLSDSDRNIPDPDPATWRLIKLRMQKHDGGTLDIELLRPLSWLETYGIKPGFTAELDLAELGASGRARVLAIAPCPQIPSGAGHVVTGAFKHSSKQIINVHVEGEDEAIGCTPNHPFWSEDREDFVPASQLRIGEKLRSAAGQSVRLTNITRRGPPEAVYNIEVHGSHTYQVSLLGVLVHNSSAQSIVTGYHATHPQVAPLIRQNGFRPGTSPGRLGSGGTYVNNTPGGAIAEFAHHNPGVTPTVLQVQYRPGINAATNVAPANYVNQLPLNNVGSISAPSIRAPGTTNTNVLNGSVVPVN